jgi:hypothetical protein
MKVEICKDERYPDYCILEHTTGFMMGTSVVEITDEEYAEYKRVDALYNEMQDKLAELGGFL